MDKREELILKLLQDIELRQMMNDMIMCLDPHGQVADIQKMMRVADEHFHKLHNEERELLIEL